MNMDKYPTTPHPLCPPIGHRRSVRIEGYDYSQAGFYFVTVCAQNRECLFGNITDDKMILNDAGRMVEKWGMELSHKFSNIKMDTYVIMPNHFHAIIIINYDANPAGLQTVVQWFKTMTTNEYIRGVKTLGWKRFNQKLWQRSYHEHVIRSVQSYQQIANYIVNNPINWKIDDFYTE